MNEAPPAGDGIAELERQLEGLFGELITLALTNPAEALPEIHRLSSALKEPVGGADPGQPKGAAIWGPHVLHFLAYGKLAEINVEADADPDEVARLCERALREYRRAYEAALYTDIETYQETVLVKPASLFRKEVTAVETRQREVRKSELDPRLLDEPLDYVAGALETAEPGSVQKLLGRTKLRYLLTAGRVSIFNAVQARMETDESVKEDLRTLFETFIEAPFEVGSATVVSCMETGELKVVSCALHEDLEPFAPDDTHNPFSMLLATKTAGQSEWHLSPVKPLQVPEG